MLHTQQLTVVLTAEQAAMQDSNCKLNTKIFVT